MIREMTKLLELVPFHPKRQNKRRFLMIKKPRAVVVNL